MALRGTARPHGGFAVEDATSCRHLLGSGVWCWETTLVRGKLNLCDGEQSREGKGMARGRDGDVLGREDAHGAFRRKTSAMFYCWT